MREKPLIILISLVSIACSSQRSSIDLDNEIYKIINLELKNNESIMLYFKSFSNDKYNGDFIRTNGSGYNCVLDVINPKLVRHKLDSIDNTSSLSKRKRDSLGIQLVKKNTIQKIWKSLPQKEAEQLSKNYIDRAIKWDRVNIDNYKTRITKKKWSMAFILFINNKVR